MYVVSIFAPSRPINSGREEDIKANRIAARCGELWSSGNFALYHLSRYTVLSPIQIEDHPAEPSAEGVVQCSIMLEKSSKEEFRIFEKRDREYNPYRDEFWTVVTYIAVIHIK